MFFSCFACVCFISVKFTTKKLCFHHNCMCPCKSSNTFSIADKLFLCPLLLLMSLSTQGLSEPPWDPIGSWNFATASVFRLFLCLLGSNAIVYVVRYYWPEGFSCDFLTLSNRIQWIMVLLAAISCVSWSLIRLPCIVGIDGWEAGATLSAWSSHTDWGMALTVKHPSWKYILEYCLWVIR